MDTKYNILTVQKGMTWDRLAHKTYGDAFLMSEILDANPEFSNVLVFEQETKIKVPVRQQEPIIRVTTPWRSSATVRIATWG